MILVPPTDYNGPIIMSLRYLKMEAHQHLNLLPKNLTFDLKAVSEEPELTVQDVSGSEDSAILLSITPTKADVNGTLGYSDK